jgi:hypothetical protein
VDALPTLKTLDRHGFDELPGTTHFQAVIKNPDFNGRAFQTIVPVSHGIDNSLLPSKGRVLESFLEEQVNKLLPLSIIPPFRASANR